MKSPVRSGVRKIGSGRLCSEPGMSKVFSGAHRRRTLILFIILKPLRGGRKTMRKRMRMSPPAFPLLPQRAGDEDAGVAAELGEIPGELLIEHHLAKVSRRGGVQEVEHSIVGPIG